MTNDTLDSTCLRHPKTLSNLRCGRCGDLICPRCMVQSPVGARCPDCARIGVAPIFRATRAELATTIALSAGAASVFGVAYGLVVWVLWQLPFNLQFGGLIASLVIGMAGKPVGDFVRRAGKYKLDSRFRFVAGTAMVVVWLIGIVVSSWLGVWSGIFMNIVGYMGLGIGTYVAMSRVRP